MLSTQDLKDLFSESNPGKVLARARRLAGKGRADQALAVLAEGAAQLGEDPEIRCEMATLHLSAGRPKEAAEMLRALLKSSSSHCSRVEEFVAWARGQHSDTEALYDPLAEGHIARRNFSAAVDCLERIGQKMLEGFMATRLANLNRFLERGAAVPKSATTTLYYAALGHEAIGDWSGAHADYRRILAASPTEAPTVDERLRAMVGRHYKNVAVRLAYAETLSSQGRGDRAIEEHLAALEIDARCAPIVSRFLDGHLELSPTSPALLWGKALVLMAQENSEEALIQCGLLLNQSSHLAEIERLLDDLTAKGKDSTESRLMRARVFTAQGKAGRAVAAVTAVLGEEGDTRGIQALEGLVSAFPDEARPWQLLADWSLKAGNVERALQAFRALRRVDSGASGGLVTRLQSILAADPAHAAAMEMFETVCLESGDPKAAVPFLRRQARLTTADAADALARARTLLMANPGDPGVRLAAAEACWASGDPVGAWALAQDLVDEKSVHDPATLRMIALCAGGSAQAFALVSSWAIGAGAALASSREVQFALGEGAARAGLLGEAVARYRQAQGASGKSDAICVEGIRTLARRAGSAQNGERAALAEALLEVGEAALAVEAARNLTALEPAVSARLADRLRLALRSQPGDIDLTTLLAQTLLAGGHVARALEIARSGLAGRDDAASAPLMLLYGDAQAATGRPSEGVKAYAAAAKRDPALAGVIIQRLERVAEGNPDSDTARVVLGRLKINEGNAVEGVAALMEAWLLKPDLAPVLLNDLERTARRHPREPVVAIARAELLLFIGQTEPAAIELGRMLAVDPRMDGALVERLESVVTRDPLCARAHLELGRGRARLGDLRKAMIAFSRVAAIAPEMSGSVLESLDHLVREHPGEAAGHLLIAMLHEREGRHLAAAEASLTAISCGAEPDPLLQGLQRLRLAMHGKDAIPTASISRIDLITFRAFRLLGRPSEAAQSCRQIVGTGELRGELALELNLLVGEHPRSVEARLCRAELAMLGGAADEGLQDLKEALSIDRAAAAVEVARLAGTIRGGDPARLDALVLIAESHEARGDLEAAGRTLSEAMGLKEGTARLDLIMRRRGVALLAGDGALASEMLARAETLAPDRDALLGLLWRESMEASPKSDSGDWVIHALQALAGGDSLAATTAANQAGESPARAWVLTLSGHPLEAAACLRGLLAMPGAPARYSALHDAIVLQELVGLAPTLMALTRTDIEALPCGEKSDQRRQTMHVGPDGGTR